MADFDIHYDPITIDVNPTTVTLEGLDNINSNITLNTPQPLKTDSRTEVVLPQPLKTELAITEPIRTELAITEPIRTESKAELDVKPLVFDQCLTIKLDPLPPTCIRQPYQQHFGITILGVEVMGFSVSGELRHIVDETDKRPQVVWGGEAKAGTISHLPSSHQPTSMPPAPLQPQSAGGLRIRLSE
ncbi:hypothetical protein KFU94_44875 [Chloroflexi bacterium TSY]|nr:hypothetical protein [Chloroflexi bacterium TSY]